MTAPTFTRRRLLQGMAGIPALAAVTAGRAQAARAVRRWAVCYHPLPTTLSLVDYDLLVLEPDAHPNLSPLRDRGTRLYGYLSAGEVEKHRPYYTRARALGFLHDENANWPGSFFVDVRDRAWVAMVVEELVPRIIRKGFGGVFLDTLDNPPELERRNPTRFKGATEAAVRLVRAIRHHHPALGIMLNRGYELLPEVLPAVDAILGESVYSDYDFRDKTYGKVDSALYERQVAILRAAQRRKPSLLTLTLDYWNINDKRTIAEIYRIQRANGFIPYVATVELDRIVPEPAA